MKPTQSNPALVTIITVVYNAAQSLIRTIESVRNQTYDSIEYVVIDGGSTDGTLDVIKSNNDLISKYLSEPDDGIYYAMNKGINMVSGDWVLFLNAGDVLTNSNLIQTIFNKPVSPDLAVIYGGIEVDINGIRRVIKPKKFSKINMIFWGSRTVCHQSLFVKNEHLEPYDTRYPVKADMDWMFKIIGRTKSDQYFQLDFPVVNYLLGGFSETTKVDSEQLKILFRNAGLFGLLGIPMFCYIFIRSRLRLF